LSSFSNTKNIKVNKPIILSTVISRLHFLPWEKRKVESTGKQSDKGDEWSSEDCCLP
jgi:hypothetical protein